MRSRLIQLLTVLGGVTVLVLAANTVALAATGRGFLLGQTNQSPELTTLERIARGPALSLRTKNDTAAPFTTNATGKVKNLDADTLDGLDSTALRDADSLQGLHPEDLQLVGRVVALSNSTSTTDFTAGLDVSALAISTVTYTVTLTGASGGSSCTLEVFRGPSDTVTWEPVLTTSSTASSPVLSDSAVVYAGQHTGYRIHCSSQTPFFAGGHAVVTFVKH